MTYYEGYYEGYVDGSNFVPPCTDDATACGGAGPSDCWNHTAVGGQCFRRESAGEGERGPGRSYTSGAGRTTTSPSPADNWRDWVTDEELDAMSDGDGIDSPLTLASVRNLIDAYHRVVAERDDLEASLVWHITNRERPREAPDA